MFGTPPIKMICRHDADDPRCSKNGGGYQPPPPPRLDPDKYEVLEAIQIGGYFGMRVKYPSCPRCEYEGVKILVFTDVTALDALKWKRIDPHFRDPILKHPNTESPSPVARFPGSDAGWEDALLYMKHRSPPGSSRRC